MSTKELLEQYVQTRTNVLGPFPDIIQKGINTIAGEVPFNLKVAITLSELITFSSHLRKPIKLYDGTLVPTNAIVFALSASGTSKDRSLNTIRKSLSTAYEHLEESRKDFAREKAENIALLEGDVVENWQKYYKAPKPLQAGLGTVEGLLHHFADIGSNPIGGGSIMSSEIGSELQSNNAMTDIIKAISIAYDLGNIPAKIVKTSENQTDTIRSLPVNALFFGSQEAILFNNDIKNRFKLVFNTQLARRSIFTFTPEPPQKLQIDSIDELYELREKERKRVLKAQKALNELTENLVQNTNQNPLTISQEANKLFDVYLELNGILSDEMSPKYPISKLSRKHKQWLALKLAGTYAILHGYEEISEKTYAYAINTVEMLASDMQVFEQELVKEPYEQLVDMCRFSADEGKHFISLHELRKMSYIAGMGPSKSKVAELCKLANSYDQEGKYEIQDGGILYKEIIKTDEVKVSAKIFNSSLKGKALKDYMSRNSAEGYELYDTDFAELGDLLRENACYSSFEFTGGIRHKDNLVPRTKFIVLDVDKSCLTDEEAHFLLEEYNHFIARTSDPDNAFKFRILLEFDAIVEVNEQIWKALVEEIGLEFGLVIDILPQSQIFLSFAERNILSQLEGKTLQTKFLLERAEERVRNKPKPVVTLPNKEKELRLMDARETFSFAFEAEKGERSTLMYRALAYAIDLGADAEYITKLAHEINDYWFDKLDEERLQRTLIKPALRRVS
jgi:hypothetical protein